MKLGPERWIVPIDERPARPIITVIGGDGVGPEVTESALACVRATGLDCEVREPLHGERGEQEIGDAFPEQVKTDIVESDAVLFGAVQAKSREILRFIRYHCQCYANLRPSASLPGIDSITGEGRTDLVIVRELTEGMYPGREGSLAELRERYPDSKDALGRPLPEDDGVYAIRICTASAATRIARYAARLAKHRQALGIGRGHVTIVHKRNVLKTMGGLFAEKCIPEIEAQGLTYDELFVDEAARRMVACPYSFDVVVTMNMFGDILSDVASEVMGGMPLVPSAGVGEKVVYFEPCHGSAPDIVGQGIANPSAAILSASMMLGYLGYAAEASRLIDALLGALQEVKPRDMGGDAKTVEITNAVIRRLESGR
ncbi:MAG: isocitrate/isopropylmalate family dehydrogenase [Deltaproteobacteria bacterium]